MGKPGRRALHHFLQILIDRHAVDYTVVNVENAAGGYGMTRDILQEFETLPIDCYTSGNHIWDKREVLTLLDECPKLLRPLNYPEGNPGSGVHVGETAAGIQVATLNVEGQVFMKSLPSPFERTDAELSKLSRDIKVIFVDFHAEATSEKQALSWYSRDELRDSDLILLIERDDVAVVWSNEAGLQPGRIGPIPEAPGATK